jgi:hypothetical protein
VTAVDRDASGAWVPIASANDQGDWIVVGCQGSGMCSAYCDTESSLGVLLSQLEPARDSLRFLAEAASVLRLPLLGEVSWKPAEGLLWIGSTAKYPECVIE